VLASSIVHLEAITTMALARLARMIVLCVPQQTIALDVCLVPTLKTTNVSQNARMDHILTIIPENVNHVIPYAHHAELQMFVMNVFQDIISGKVDVLSVKMELHSLKENVLYVIYHAPPAKDLINAQHVLRDTTLLMDNVLLILQSVLIILMVAILVPLITRNARNVIQDIILHPMATANNVLKDALIVKTH